MSFPIQGQMLRAGVCGVLFVISARGEFPSVVVEGVHKDPVRGVDRDRVTNPLDVIEELALVLNPIVLGVYKAFDEIFWVFVNDERRRGQLVAIFKGVARGCC